MKNSIKLKVSSGAITAPCGFRAAGLASGIKKNNKLDVSLVFSETDARAAAMFTTNKVKAWPLLVDKRHLRHPYHRAFIVNSGNANCSNGRNNEKKIYTYCKVLADALHIDVAQVLPSSTGIIGREFPVEKILTHIEPLVRLLACNDGHAAAQGILTTDTRTKEAFVTFIIENKKVTIGAMAKGAGMFHPNMATMLGFFTTDVAISKLLLQQALREVVAQTFNVVNVDNDMSTNDTIMVLANGRAGNKCITQKDARYRIFVKALFDLSRYIAKELVRDGEGVTRICEMHIRGAYTQAQAIVAARALGTSMLFKTALHGADPNWGRIVAALGSQPRLRFDLQKISIAFGPYIIFSKGKPHDVQLRKAQKELLKKEVHLHINLAAGTACTDYITSDLSKQYIAINADYTT